MIKPLSPPPPQSKLPAYVLYILSVITTLALVFLFILYPCCCGSRRRKNGVNAGPMAGGMMVLPVQGLPGQKNGKKKKKGQKGDGDGVQVNLIVDPSMFGGAAHDGPDDDYATTEDGSMPGGYNASHTRRPPRRRGVFAGLALEEDWRHARSWRKKIAFVDAVCLVLWGAEFVLILLGKRCPSGKFSGWCDAYNLASAMACLLCLAFSFSVFFDVKDLHDSRASPRTRP